MHTLEVVSLALLSLSAFLAACALHPFVTYPISLALFATRRVKAATGSTDRLSVAICMSAYNEEAVIVDKVRSLIAAAEAYGNATVHIYTDGCSDRTEELLRPFADRIDLIVSHHRCGKTHGMNLLLERSTSALVMFADANVVSDDRIISQLATPFGDPTVGCTTARLLYSNSDESATSLAGSIYWAMEESIKQIESSTVGVIGVDGASFMIRRSLYCSAPDDLIDDLFVTLCVLATGAQVVRVAEAVVYERSAVKAEEEYRRKVRIACQAVRVHRQLWPMIRTLPTLQVYAYISHRLIKWLVPFLVAGSLIAITASFTMLFGWWALASSLAALFAVLIGGLANVPGFSFVYTVGFSLFGVAHGVLQGFFSRNTFTTWDPVASVRTPPPQEVL